jgi:hypothetical protein
LSDLVAPLTDLMKKGAFRWIDEAQKTFDRMNEVMSTFLVLSLPYFTYPFVLECYALGEGKGEFLMQHRHMIAYERRKITELERLYSIYNKEMLAIMYALVKFRQNLVGGKFVVKTYHNSLRNFLGKKDLNERQQKWVSKL